MAFRFVSFVILSLAWPGFAAAQAVASADVNIVSVNAELTGNEFVCTAVINNQNDDDARNANVIVLLPLQVSIKQMAVLGGGGNCVKSNPQGGFNGYATCSLGQLPQGPNVRRTIRITTTRSTAAPSYPHTCSAFIYSEVGDITKDNNYKWAVAQAVAATPPAPGPAALGNEDCVGFNTANARAALVQGRWKLVDGSHWILDFGNKQNEAQRAEQIVKRYNINRQCFVGRPNASFTYWLSGNQAAAGAIQGEDCVGFNPAAAQVSNAGGVWRVVDGNHAMFAFPNQPEAQRALQIIKYYGWTQSCFVGRPQPSMSYQRK